MLIIPTYNERNNIAPLVDRIRQAVGEEGIFFVDDSSPDGTAEEIRRLQQQDKCLHLLIRPGKFGYGSACRQAMQKIIRDKLDDRIIQFDADLSHPPELLPRMIDLLRDHEVVVGSRYISGGAIQNWNIPRRVLSRGANLYARTFTGVPVHDMTSGFVGYQMQALRGIDLATIQSDGYAFLMEMKFVLYQRGTRFHEFPIVFTEREQGVSKFNLRIAMEGVRFPLKTALQRFRRRARVRKSTARPS